MAFKLSRSGQSTLIVDRDHQPGGLCRPTDSDYGELSYGLKVLPDSEAARSSLGFLRNLLEVEPFWSENEQETTTFEAGFKSFVGYGETAPEYAEEIEYYTSPKTLELSYQPHQWVKDLSEKYNGDYLAGSFITRIGLEDEKATHVLINGGKKVEARNIVFCGMPKELINLVGIENLPSKAKKALGKPVLWTSVALDLVHSEKISDSRDMHLLMGNKDKSEACWGRFQEVDEEGHQVSNWMTLLPADLAEDSESTANALKRIQKQVKRAYPEAFEKKKKERILVSFASHGSFSLALSGHQTLPKIDNLWIASGQAHVQKNLLGVLGQAQLALSAMGFGEEIHEAASVDEPAEEVDAATHNV